MEIGFCSKENATATGIGVVVGAITVVAVVARLVTLGDTLPLAAGCCIIIVCTDGDMVAVGIEGAVNEDGDVMLFHGNGCCLSSEIFKDLNFRGNCHFKFNYIYLHQGCTEIAQALGNV